MYALRHVPIELFAHHGMGRKVPAVMKPGKSARITIRKPAAGSALALAAAVLATGFAATASAAPAATGKAAAPAGGRTVPAIAGPAVAGDTVKVTSHFLWRPTATSDAGDSTFINNGATNSKKNDLLFVMPNLTPGGIDPCPCLLEATPVVGVWYDGSKWAVFNEDGSDMGQIMSYNVLVVPKASKSAFTVHATSSATHGDYVIINSPLTNGHPDALMQVTQNYAPSKVFNPHVVGVRYFKVRHRWAIFNEDGAALPQNAAFNVLVGSAASNGGRTAVLTATAANRQASAVNIANSVTNGDPNNVIFATQSFNPGGKGGTSNLGNIVAGYNVSKEAVLNWGAGAAPLKASFNLLMFNS